MLLITIMIITKEISISNTMKSIVLEYLMRKIFLMKKKEARKILLRTFRMFDIQGVLSDKYLGTELFKSVGDLGALKVRALHLIAVTEQNFGNPRHPDPANSDEMDRSHIHGQFGFEGQGANAGVSEADVGGSKADAGVS